MPIDSEKIAWMNIPKPDIHQFLFYLRRDLGGIFHLRIGGNDNVAFFRSLDGICPSRCFDGEVNSCHRVLLLKLSDNLNYILQLSTICFCSKKIFFERMYHIEHKVLPFPWSIILLYYFYF